MSVLGFEEDGDAEDRLLTPLERSAFQYALADRPKFESVSQSWNKALWMENEIRERVNKLMRAGCWPAPVGWCTDIFSDQLEFPKDDFLQSLRPKKPRLVTRDGEVL